MKNRIPVFMLPLVLLLISFTGVAQSNMVQLAGTVQGKVTTELSILKVKNGKKIKLATYFKDSANTQFAFLVPADDSATFSFQITVMKRGHRRMEAVNGASYPLQIKAGRNLTITVNSTLLNKKGAFNVGPATGKTSAAFITGSLLNWKLGGELMLNHVVDGVVEPVASSFLQRGETQFSFALLVKQEGFYTISTVRWHKRIYLQPNDTLELNFEGKKGIAELVNASPENQLHEKWQQLIAPVTNYGYNRIMLATDTIGLDQYIATYQQIQPALTAFTSTVTSKNLRFNQLFQQAMAIDKELAPIRYLQIITTKRKKGIFISEARSFTEVPLFYQQFISDQKFTNARSLQVPEFISFMNLYAMLQEALLPTNKKQILTVDEKLKLMMDVIGNDTLKTIFLKEKLGTIELNNLTEFKRTFEPYKQFAKTKAVKEKYNEVRVQFIGDTAFVGKSSYNFSLPDTSGKMVSMKDFKGKVVFIDVWATWCGPCKEQFPHMKTLEEEYKDNSNIVFVGISLDRNKDKEKWLAMIRKEKLVGVQLMDDIGLAFGRKYEILGIPRFLLIDKQGRWIEVRCPRPSSKEELKRYIDQALQQNAL
jgi:thiol-disulfide isomerase/thioredoxin